jgi:hypothetical protein
VTPPALLQTKRKMATVGAWVSASGMGMGGNGMNVMGMGGNGMSAMGSAMGMGLATTSMTLGGQHLAAGVGSRPMSPLLQSSANPLFGELPSPAGGALPPSCCPRAPAAAGPAASTTACCATARQTTR